MVQAEIVSSVRGASRVLRTQASCVPESEEKVPVPLCQGGGRGGQFPALSPGSCLWSELDQAEVLLSLMWGQPH